MTEITIKALRQLTGMSQRAFAEYLHVPPRTIENWESDSTNGRKCASYIIELIQYKLEHENLIPKNPE